MATTGVGGPPYWPRPLRSAAVFTVTLKPAYQNALPTGTVFSLTVAGAVVEVPALALTATATVGAVPAAAGAGGFSLLPQAASDRTSGGGHKFASGVGS